MHARIHIEWMFANAFIITCDIIVIVQSHKLCELMVLYGNLHRIIIETFSPKKKIEKEYKWCTTSKWICTLDQHSTAKKSMSIRRKNKNPTKDKGNKHSEKWNDNNNILCAFYVLYGVHNNRPTAAVTASDGIHSAAINCTYENYKWMNM